MYSKGAIHDLLSRGWDLLDGRNYGESFASFTEARHACGLCFDTTSEELMNALIGMTQMCITIRQETEKIRSPPSALASSIALHEEEFGLGHAAILEKFRLLTIYLALRSPSNRYETAIDQTLQIYRRRYISDHKQLFERSYWAVTLLAISNKDRGNYWTAQTILQNMINKGQHLGKAVDPRVCNLQTLLNGIMLLSSCRLEEYRTRCISPQR